MTRPVITHNSPWRGTMTRAELTYKRWLRQKPLIETDDHWMEMWRQRRCWHGDWMRYGNYVLQTCGSDRAKHDWEDQNA